MRGKRGECLTQTMRAFFMLNDTGNTTSTHPFNTLYEHAINTLSHYTLSRHLSIHFINTPSHPPSHLLSSLLTPAIPGMCTTRPRLDCSTESWTTPGREATNFLSLNSPLATGYFTALGNSFGGEGMMDAVSVP